MTRILALLWVIAAKQQGNEMNAAQVAQRFGCTVEQAQNLYRKNALQLQSMANQAKRTGRNVNNYTAAQLDQRAASFLAKVAA
jgi:hypothetical protein